MPRKAIVIFTSRTYRIAIRRSIQLERLQIGWITETVDPQTKQIWVKTLHQQINHTRRLQARKRKERK